MAINSQTRLASVHLGLLAIAIFASGCGLGPPEGQTMTVTGQVMTNKGEPVTSGVVQFDGFTGSQRKASAVINGDGSFTFEAVQSNGLRGIPEGLYRCSVALDPNDENAKPIRLPQSYKVAKDMKQPLIILIPRQRGAAPAG